MLKFYTSHCFMCNGLKAQMDKKGIVYEEIDDMSVFMPIAEENNITSMPFAELDGKVLTMNELQKFIVETEGE